MCSFISVHLFCNVYDKDLREITLCVTLELSLSTPRKHGRGKLHLFLTLALNGGELLTSRPGLFNPTKEPRYSLNRGLNGPHRQ
jgi:hypothetical protein